MNWVKEDTINLKIIIWVMQRRKPPLIDKREQFQTVNLNDRIRRTEEVKKTGKDDEKSVREYNNKR